MMEFPRKIKSSLLYGNFWKNRKPHWDLWENYLNRLRISNNRESFKGLFQQRICILRLFSILKAKIRLLWLQVLDTKSQISLSINRETDNTKAFIFIKRGFKVRASTQGKPQNYQAVMSNRIVNNLIFQKFQKNKWSKFAGYQNVKFPPISMLVRTQGINQPKLFSPMESKSRPITCKLGK